MTIQTQCDLVPANKHQFDLTVSPVPDEQRLDFWPPYFGDILQWISLGPRIFAWMDRFYDKYNGGIWSFYILSNGGVFIAPDADGGDKWHLFNSMNGNGVEMSVEAVGTVVCLIGYSHHACRTECDTMTEYYYRLRDYAPLHPESSAILRIIDQTGEQRMKQLSLLPGGMTPQDRRLIQRVLKALERHLHKPEVAFTSARAVREWLRLYIAALERKELRVLYLGNQNQLITHETLSNGTANRVEVCPREVVKRALYFNAAAVILTHNHPSGETTPSQAGKVLTQRLTQALQLVDIRVPDHLIVGDKQIYSFVEHGLL